MLVNKHSVEPDTSDDRFLHIHNKKIMGKNLLHKGKNRVSVLYSSEYDTTGEGCVTHTEVSDNGKKSQYLYTQFEAYCANMVFPCFDQPDLKAPMRLTITAPSIWKILSNEKSSWAGNFNDKEYGPRTKLHGQSGQLLARFYQLMPKQEEKMITTVFPPTKIMSTYLYCFIAGDYEEIVCPL